MDFRGRQRAGLVCAVLAGSLVGLLAAPNADAADCGGQRACRCGDRVTEDTILRKNVLCRGPSPVGLKVAAGVQLRCRSPKVGLKCAGNAAKCPVGVVVESAEAEIAAPTSVSGCLLRGWSVGVSAGSSSSGSSASGSSTNGLPTAVVISGNQFEGVGAAIDLRDVARADVLQNTVVNSDGGFLVRLSSSSQAVLRIVGNVVSRPRGPPGSPGIDVKLGQGVYASTIELDRNNISGASIVVAGDVAAGASLPGVGALVLLNNSLEAGRIEVGRVAVERVTVENNQLTRATAGIVMWTAMIDTGSIDHNAITCVAVPANANSGAGIAVHGRKVAVEANQIEGCLAGVVARGRIQTADEALEGLVVRGNSVTSGFGVGVCRETIGVVVEGNTFDSGVVGVASFGAAAAPGDNPSRDVEVPDCQLPQEAEAGACDRFARGTWSGDVDLDLLCGAAQSDGRTACPLRFVVGRENDPVPGAGVLMLRSAELPAGVTPADGLDETELSLILADAPSMWAGEDPRPRSRSGGCLGFEGLAATDADGRCTGGLVAGSPRETHVAIALVDEGYAPAIAGSVVIEPPVACGSTVLIPRPRRGLTSVTYAVTHDRRPVEGAVVVALDERFAKALGGVDVSDGVDRTELETIGRAVSKHGLPGQLPEGVTGACLSGDPTRRQGPGATGADGRCRGVVRAGARAPQVVIAFMGPPSNPTAIGMRRLTNAFPSGLIEVALETLPPLHEVCGNGLDDDRDGISDNGTLTARTWSQVRTQDWRGTRVEVVPAPGAFVMFFERRALAAVGIRKRVGKRLTRSQIARLDKLIVTGRLPVHHQCTTAVRTSQAGLQIADCSRPVHGGRDYVAIAVRHFPSGRPPAPEHVTVRRAGKLRCESKKTIRRLVFRLPPVKSGSSKRGRRRAP